MSPFAQMYLFSLIPATLAIVGCVALMWKVSLKHLDAGYGDERAKPVIAAAAIIICIVVVALLIGGSAAGHAALDALKPECK